MIQKIIRFLRGYVKIRIAGYSPERFLNLCSYHQIYLWGLSPCENSYEMYLSLSAFRRLRPIVRKTHVHLTVVQRAGLPFLLRRYRRRKLFFVGFLLCVSLLYVYSGFIWDIHFEGNEKWTDEVLLEFLAEKDVTPHMRKKEVDCAGIVRDIRKEYNDIVWVSASIDGSRLRIQIKENDDTFETTAKEEEKPNDLVAAEDGVITQIVTRAGTPQVHIGDQVKKGDILVSGRVDVMNDAGEVTDYQYKQADADVYADTQMEYEDTMDVSYRQKTYGKPSKYQVFLQIGRWRFTIGSLKNSYKEKEVFSAEHQMKLGENFYLPVTYGKYEVKPYTSAEKKHTEKEIQDELSENFIQFSKELQEKGIQIQENSVKIHIDQNSASAKGILYLNQKIAEKADTEILEIERKNEDESLGTDN